MVNAYMTMECQNVNDKLANESNEQLAAVLKLECHEKCSGVPAADCLSYADKCQYALDVLANESNEISKLELKSTCEEKCKEVETAECGFLVNSLSMILFAFLAAIKNISCQ